jgi:hypothetical protein
LFKTYEFSNSTGYPDAGKAWPEPRASVNSLKGDAAELVLDGRLIGERSEEINLAELLPIAHREFDQKTKTIDETLLQQLWPALPDRLAASQPA